MKLAHRYRKREGEEKRQINWMIHTYCAWWSYGAATKSKVSFKRANHHHVMLQWLVANSKINIGSLASCSKGPSHQPMMSATSHNWENEDTLTPALQGHFFCAVPKQQLSPSLILCCLPLALANHAVSEHGFLRHYHVDIWPMCATINSHFICSCRGAKTRPNLIKNSFSEQFAYL